MAAYFPIFISLEQKKVHIFGAGNIAVRRMDALLRFGALVKVTALQFHEAVNSLKKAYPMQLQTEQRAYQKGEIQAKEADFVLAATDDTRINACIFQECRKKGIPVNNASDKDQCDFYFPALAERDGLVIGVASVDGDHRKVAEFSRRLREDDFNR